MIIKLWLIDEDGNNVDLGHYLTDSVQAVLDTFKGVAETWEEQHQAATDLCWDFVNVYQNNKRSRRTRRKNHGNN